MVAALEAVTRQCALRERRKTVRTYVASDLPSFAAMEQGIVDPKEANSMRAVAIELLDRRDRVPKVSQSRMHIVEPALVLRRAVI